MPELPEVQTTVTGLQKKITCLTITNLWSNSFSMAYVNRNNHKNKDYFVKLQQKVAGKNIVGVTRRGKHILIILSSGETLVIHMKMTGHLMHGVYEYIPRVSASQNVYAAWGPWIPKIKDSPLSDPYNRHIRTMFTLQNKEGKESHLAFCDSRKFGTIELFSANDLQQKIGKLGPEPLEPSFTFKVFKEVLSKKRSGYIKSVLLDQTVLVGVGNIYSDEALHLAHILPTRDVTSLSETERNKLYQSIRQVLTSGIHFGGDSMSDYRNVDGERGAFQGKHLVYLRTGKSCVKKDCSGIIEKKTIGGRSGHYCPLCQK